VTSVKRVFIAVPGERDRAFYKIFVKGVTRLHGLQYIDLDSRERMEEKQRLVNDIMSQEDSPGIRLRGVSAAVLQGRSGSTEVVIWPMKGEKGEGVRIAWFLLLYQLGLEAPKLNHFVVATDLEVSSAQRVLQGLLDSLASRQPCVRSSQTERGRYYLLVRNVCRRRLDLLLVAQGLEHVEPVSQAIGQHALEDFIVYLSWGRLRSLLDKCPRLWELVRGARGHKKLATLAALEHCRPGVDEKFFNRVLTPESVERLCSIHDGLAKLNETLVP